MRAMCVGGFLLSVLVPNVGAGQTSVAASAPSNAGREGRERLILQVAAGPMLIDRGRVLSAAFGYTPAPRLELLLNIECDQRSYRFERSNGGSRATGGGGMTFVSGELRLALRPPDRVSPFAVAGLGGGVSRPDFDDDGGSTDLLVVYVGGGLRVPLRRGFSLFGDVRVVIDAATDDDVPTVWPVQAGVAWRF